MISLANPTAEVYVPGGTDPTEALARATHMAIAAHHDDLEILAADGILRCYRDPERSFVGVVVTDGAGAPRSGPFATTGNAEMCTLRRSEQRAAADLGEYGAAVLLDHPSAAVREGPAAAVVDDLEALLSAARPEVVYTHNLADAHDTHVAVTMRLVAAVRRLAPTARPRALYGCEVWRDLDWLVVDDKVVFDLSAHHGLQSELLRVFCSQIEGGKRYDLATLGRRRAHATFHMSHEVDVATLLSFAMDLTPLLEDDALEPRALVDRHLERFADDVRRRLGRVAT